MRIGNKRNLHFKRAFKDLVFGADYSESTLFKICSLTLFHFFTLIFFISFIYIISGIVGSIICF